MKERIRRVALVAGYPVLLTAALVTTALVSDGLAEGAAAGTNPALAAGIVLVPFTIILALLERAMPFTKRWAARSETVRVDLMHTAVSGVLVAPTVRAVLLALIVGTLAAPSSSLWPSEAPLMARAALAIVVADLGAYAGHRFMHATALGWRLHAVHHSASSLYVLAAARSHPFNAMLTLSLEGLPLILLGVSPEALALATAFKGANGLLQHANLDLRPGRLSWLVATSDVHRWHHSTNRDESNTNFGNATMLWDHVFGTFSLPARRPPVEVGIGGSPIPESYLAHLATPFTLHDREPDATGPKL
jgi:ornithine lipid hydroxylase